MSLRSRGQLSQEGLMASVLVLVLVSVKTKQFRKKFDSLFHLSLPYMAGLCAYGLEIKISWFPDVFTELSWTLCAK